MNTRQLKIEQNLLKLFRQSIGMRFRLKGNIQGVPLEDEVAGIDEEFSHVKGKTYGNFHVSLCELIP